jgi:hypothetical protein
MPASHASTNFERTSMTSRFIKIGTALALLGGSAAAFAAQACCGDIACCLQQLLCCL